MTEGPAAPAGPSVVRGGTARRKRAGHRSVPNSADRRPPTAVRPAREHTVRTERRGPGEQRHIQAVLRHPGPHRPHGRRAAAVAGEEPKSRPGPRPNPSPRGLSARVRPAARTAPCHRRTGA
ncbi:hypothetical protein ADK41_37265 [Streptomyces caelestis]|uniref:Uncharacterized protein n=1 Tax=Streptomyces caelestis TaxID=36816 RepID=A0A0M8QJ03_9ACTN|nr:hypothetical protein ADK41_37265 [Streptomyces caelestis]